MPIHRFILRTLLILTIFNIDPGHLFATSRRIALIVGNNLGTEKEEPLKYAENEAENLYKTLLEIGDISPYDIYLLTGKNASDTITKLEELTDRVQEISHQEDVLFIFYYTGHASSEALHLGETAIGIADLKKRLGQMKARTVITLVDSCKSGSFIRQKGIKRSPPFKIQVDNQELVQGRVFITSSSAFEVSIESESVRGSYFSHYLISGLRGDADSNHDGKVDLNEIYKYTYENTVMRTVETDSGIQHPSFELDIRGSGDMVMTWPQKSDAALVFGAELEGVYLIIAKHGRQLMAEVNKSAGNITPIALPAQSYIVKKKVEKGFLVGEFNLTWGGKKSVDEKFMEFVSHEQIALKGEMPILSPNAIYATFDFRNGIANGNRFLVGTTLTYSRDILEICTLGGAITYATGSLKAVELSIPTHAIAVEFLTAYRFNWSTFRLSLGGGLGWNIIWQEIPSRENRRSIGFLSEIIISSTWIFADPMFLAVEFRGGLEVEKLYGDYGVQPRLIGSVGMGVLF